MKLNYTFDSEELLKKALTHKSAGKNNNERLEFLGDSLVNFFIADILFQRFPEATEGQLSRLRSSLVRKETLADIAREINLGNSLILGSGELKSGGFRRDSILADTLESLIAAIYLDSDFETCQQEVLNWFADKLDNLTLNFEQRDYKTRLQEWQQGKSRSLPEYRLIDTSGKDHNKAFTVQCVLEDSTEVFIGSGKNKKAAEQEAAKEALNALQQLQEY